MTNSRLLLGLIAAGCVSLLAGCPTAENPSAAGLTCDHGSHICVGTLAITMPSTTVYTNATVAIQVAANPGNNPPPEVDIRVDDMLIATIPPPFNYSWATANVAEGEHMVQAAADVGGTTITSNTVTVWVDRTPPDIAMRTPAANATNVALSDPIQVVFDEALDPSSISNAAVTLTSGGSTLSATSSLEKDGKTIDVVLGSHSTLSFPATITATVNPMVKDLAGNAVGTLQAWSWTAPLWVRMPSLTGDNAYVALDPSGKATVVYLNDLTTGSRTMTLAQYAAGAVWDMTIGTPSVTASGAAIAVGSDGAPVVAWSDSQSMHVQAARWGGTTWNGIGGDIEAIVPAVDSVMVSSLALTSSGTPLVSWSGQQGVSNYGYVASYSGTAWQALPADASAGVGSILLRLDSTGNPVGFFLGYVGVSRSVQKYESGTWSSVDNETGLVDAAVDSQNQPVALVSTVESNAFVFHLRVPGTSGSTELTPSLPTGNAGTIGLGRLVFGPNGNAVLMWTQADSSSTYRLHVARFNGTAWDTTLGVLSGVSGSSLGVNTADIAVDAAAEPTVAWSEQDGTTNAVAVYVWKSNY